MKIVLFFAMAGLALSVHAGILAGPVVNPLNGHSYYLLSQNTWSNAEAEAVSMGGHLATIRSAAEDQWISSTFGDHGGALWIGLNDRDKVFTFTWTSGEPVTYTNWGAGQPDNGTGGVEYYAHIWPSGHSNPPAGKWNDYANDDNVLGFPLYGVVELSPAATARLPVRVSLIPAKNEASVNADTAAISNPELRAFTAIEVCWNSEINRLYQVQWTPSLVQPHWVNLDPLVSGTGANVSFFDSTRTHPQGFFRVQVMK